MADGGWDGNVPKSAIPLRHPIIDALTDCPAVDTTAMNVELGTRCYKDTQRLLDMSGIIARKCMGYFVLHSRESD